MGGPIRRGRHGSRRDAASWSLGIAIVLMATAAADSSRLPLTLAHTAPAAAGAEHGDADGFLDDWPGRLDWSPLPSDIDDKMRSGRRRLGERHLPSLTTKGKTIKTVVFASMLGGTCESDDWRGDLPRHLMRFLPGASGVLVFARDPSDRECKSCGVRGARRRQDCKEYLGKGKNGVKADLLVVIGTGRVGHCSGKDKRTGLDVCLSRNPKHYTSLDGIFHSHYTDNNTLAVHIPVRKIRPLSRNQLFGFQHIIHDDEFLKPLAVESLKSMRRSCEKAQKERRLMYVGRYVDSKGQLEFLRRVDPKMLQGYTIDFYGAGYEEGGLPDEIRRLAKARGIAAEVHGAVSHQTLLKAYCSSVGQIHFAMGDNNPRAGYEGLYAGNPLFATLNSKLPAPMYQQSFVVGLRFNSTEHHFHAEFQRFMRLVGNKHTTEAVTRWVDSNLVPEKVYEKLCRRIGVCESQSRGEHVRQVVRAHRQAMAELTQQEEKAPQGQLPGALDLAGAASSHHLRHEA